MDYHPVSSKATRSKCFTLTSSAMLCVYANVGVCVCLCVQERKKAKERKRRPMF